MNEELLKNIYNQLVSDKLTESDYDTWKSNISSNDEIKINVHGYLADNGFTESDYDSWNSNVFGKVKKKEDFDSTLESQKLDSSGDSVNISSDTGDTLIDKIDRGEIEIPSKEIKPEYTENEKLHLKKGELFSKMKTYQKKHNSGQTLTEEEELDWKRSSEDFQYLESDDRVKLDTIIHNLQSNVSKKEDLKNRLKGGTLETLGGLAGIPNFLNKLTASIILPKEALEEINKLTPKQREIVLANFLPTTGIASRSNVLASADAQNMLTEKADKLLEKTIEYEGNIIDDFSSGRIGQGLYRTLQGAVQSAPSLALALAPSGIIAIGAGTAAQKQERQEQEGKAIGFKTVLNSSVNGIAEGFFEKYTAGILKPFKQIAFGNKQVAKEISENLTKTIFKDLGIEASSEFATSFAQDLSDKLIVGEDISLNQMLKNAIDGGIVGGFMGGGISSTKGITSYIATKTLPDESKKIVLENEKTILNLEVDKSNTEDGDLKNTLEEKQKSIKKQNDEIFEKEKEKVENLNDEDVKSVFEISEKLNELKNRKDKILKDKNISQESKDIIISDLDSEIEKLTSNKNNFTSIKSNEDVNISDYHNENSGSSIKDGKPLTEGYSVSPYLDRTKKIKGKDISKEDVESFREANKDLLENENNFIGTWYDSKTNTTYLDVSIHESNQSKAIELGKSHNQKAIWDLKNNEEIDTEGDGEIKIVKDSKSPDFTPDVDPKIKKERENSKKKLKALRDKKNKKASDIKAIKREAANYIKSFLGVKDLKEIKKSEFNTIIQQLRDVEYDNKGNLKTPTDINDIIDNLENQINKTSIRRDEKKIDKLLKVKTVDSSKKGTLPKDAIDVLQAYKQLSSDDITVDEIEVMKNSGEFTEAFEEALDIVESLKLANDKDTSLSDKAELYESISERLQNIISEGRLQTKELRAEDSKRKKENIKEARVDSSRKSREQLDLIEQIKEAEKNPILEDKINSIREIADKIGAETDVENSNTLEEAKSALKKIKDDYFKEENFSKKIKTKNAILDAIHQSYRYITSDLDTFIDFVSKKSSKNLLGGYLHSKISDGVRKAEESYMKLTRKNKTVIHDKMKEIYSKNYSSFVRKVGDVVDSVVAENSKVIDTGIFDSQGNEIKLSKSNVMWLYNQYKNSKTHDNFEKAGLTPEVMNKLTSEFLTESDIEFADWLTDEYYPSLHSQINPIFKKLYFRNLPKIDKYGGQIRYQGVDGVKSTDMLSDSGYTQEGATLFFGSGIDRVNNARPISTSQDIFNSLFNYTDSANRFTSSAETYRDIKEILNDDIVTDNFKNYNRGNIKGQIEQLIDLSFGFKERKDANLITNFLIGAKILSSLALTPKILATQAISTTLWLSENIDSVVGNTLLFLTNPIKGVKYMREIYNNSEYIRGRYEGESGFKKVEAAYIAQNMKIGQKYRAVRLGRRSKDFLFGKLALSNIMLGDAIGMFSLGVPYYKAMRDEGMKKFNDEQKAIEYAISKFNKKASKNQQSYKSNDRDLAQHTDLGKVVNMYGNSPKQYHRNTVQGLLQVKRALQGREYKGTVVANVWKVVLNHMIQGALYQWVGTALVGLLSEDDEEETKIKDVLWGATFGSFAKFFIIGDLVQSLWDTGQGRPFGENPTLPIYADYGKLFKLISDYKEASQKEDDVKMGEVSKKIYTVLLDLAGIPATKTSSLVENYDKVINGDYDSGEEMILRLLNYSQFAIDNMNEENRKASEKARQEKAKETRKRRNPNKNKESKFKERF